MKNIIIPLATCIKVEMRMNCKNMKLLCKLEILTGVSPLSLFPKPYWEKVPRSQTMLLKMVLGGSGSS